MDASEQETQQAENDWEEVAEESLQTEQESKLQPIREETGKAEQTTRQKRRKNESRRGLTQTKNRSSFVNGLAAGLGIGCVAAFVMMWVAVFFTPRLSTGITYEALLATFIFPLIYLLALGLVALTLGVVSEYRVGKDRA